MTKRFIPDSDSEFEKMAHGFALTAEKNPRQFGLSARDAKIITEAVDHYRTARHKAVRKDTRSMNTIRKKDEARERAERIIRKNANLIRANDEIKPGTKKLLGINERPKRLKRRECPDKPPVLKLRRIVDSTHELEFRAGVNESRAKPHGAARLELYVDLVPIGEPPPIAPGPPGNPWTRTSETPFGGGGPWYLRSFTTNPIRVKHPLPGAPNEPRMVVYWARWADATGEVGPWSRTLVTRMEGEIPVPGLKQETVTCDDDSPQLQLAG